MKIFVSHSREFDYINEMYKPLRQATFFKDQELILPHETEHFLETKPIIQDANLILAEISFPSAGQGIELGWANDAGIPIVCFYKEGSKISHSLHAVSTVFLAYTSSEDMVQKLLGHIQN